MPINVGPTLLPTRGVSDSRVGVAQDVARQAAKESTILKYLVSKVPVATPKKGKEGHEGFG